MSDTADPMVLFSGNAPGNVHEMTRYMNVYNPDLAPYVRGISSNGGCSHGIVWGCAPKSLVDAMHAKGGL